VINVKQTLAALTASLGMGAALLTFASPANAWGQSHNCSWNNGSHVCATHVADGIEGSILPGAAVSGHTLDFNLDCVPYPNGRAGTWFGDLGPFTAQMGVKRTYVFKTQNQGLCEVRVHDSTNGMNYYSGQIDVRHF
jgi:hypothetical protein